MAVTVLMATVSGRGAIQLGWSALMAHLCDELLSVRKHHEVPMSRISASQHSAPERVLTPPSPQDEDFTLLTVDEVAALLKVSKSWVYERTRSHARDEHALPFVKLGKYLRFDGRDIRTYIDQQRKAVRLKRSRWKSLPCHVTF